MSRIQIIAPEGTTFTIGGKRITDKTPIWANGAEYRIRKYLGDGSILLYEEEVKPKKRGRPAKVKKETPEVSESLETHEAADKPKEDEIKVDALLADLPDESSEALITEE